MRVCLQQSWRIACWLGATLAIGCGGSSSETPEPVRPDSWQLKLRHQHQLAADINDPNRALPRLEGLGEQAPARSTWGVDGPSRNAATKPVLLRQLNDEDSGADDSVVSSPKPASLAHPAGNGAAAKPAATKPVPAKAANDMVAPPAASSPKAGAKGVKAKQRSIAPSPARPETAGTVQPSKPATPKAATSSTPAANPMTQKAATKSGTTAPPTP